MHNDLDDDVETNPVWLAIYAAVLTFSISIAACGWLPN